MEMCNVLLIVMLACFSRAEVVTIGTYGWAKVVTLGDTVDFQCELTGKNGSSVLPTNATRVVGTERWLLPGKSVTIGPSFKEGNKELINQGTTLRISNVTYSDGGIYLCYMDISCIDGSLNCTENSYMWMKHGLNLNGPLYANTLDKYRENFIIGGAAAGGVLGLILLLCLIYKFRYKELKEVPSYELSSYTGKKLSEDTNGRYNLAAENTDL